MMQSHLKPAYNQLPETKADENALYGYDISYEQFKEALHETIQNKKRFIDISVQNSINLTASFSYQVERKLDDHVANYLKEYPEYTKRYRQEVQSAKRWDILEISASVLCCIPSYIITFLHCCGPCLLKKECADEMKPDHSCGDFRTCSTLYPGCNFFCKPVGNVKDKLADYRHQKQISHEILSKGPNPQRMQ